MPARHETAANANGNLATFLVETIFFAYLWQCASFVHISSHFAVARILGVDATLHLAWQKLIPVYGWMWDKWHDHSLFMCEYDNIQIQKAEAWKRTSIGFAGQCGFLLMFRSGP